MKSASRHRVLPGLSGILATGPPLHSISLKTMFMGNDARRIAGELGADAEAGVDAATEVAEQLDRLVGSRPSEKHQRLGGGIDAEALVWWLMAFSPTPRGRRVVAQPGSGWPARSRSRAGRHPW